MKDLTKIIQALEAPPTNFDTEDSRPSIEAKGGNVSIDRALNKQDEVNIDAISEVASEHKDDNIKKPQDPNYLNLDDLKQIKIPSHHKTSSIGSTDSKVTKPKRSHATTAVGRILM